MSFLNYKKIIKTKIFQFHKTPMYSDSFMLKLLDNNIKIQKICSSDLLKDFYEYMLHEPRFVDFNFIDNFLEISHYFMNHFFQGVISPPTWKGLKIFKTIEDITLYTMLLQDISFKSIVELGTGNGNSLKFFQDISSNNLEIMSFDINGTQDYCDLTNLDNLKSYQSKLKKLPSPILFIEDSHTNTFEVLDYLFQFSTPGCYFYIEDSLIPEKFKEVKKFYEKYKNNLFVDKKYTGKFGQFNSIILKHLK